jgi:hypothetical protein
MICSSSFLAACFIGMFGAAILVIGIRALIGIIKFTKENL